MAVAYVSGSETLVDTEFRAFLDARQDEAADSIAILHHVAVAGLDGLDGNQRDGLGIARPYCHQAAGWGVFFEVAGQREGPCTVSVLLVAEFDRMPIEPAKREAIRRWEAAKGQEMGT
jgi:hypothetical protein